MHTSDWQSVSLSLDECIKCNICTSYCPVSAVTDLFPGPKYVGPQAQRYRQAGQAASPDASVDYCSGCRVCNDVCPAGVKIAEINGRARAQIVADRGLSLRNRLLGRNETLGRLGSLAPGLANFAVSQPLGRRLAARALGIAAEAPLPTWSRQGSLRRWLEKSQDQRLKSEKKVAYFHNCSINYYEPFVGQAAVAVLEHNGYEVVAPPQNCCGLPMLSNGEFDAGGDYYDRNVEKLRQVVAAGYDIVGTSPSCTLTLKEEAPELLDRHDEAHRQLKNAVWDIFEWLRQRHEEGELRLDFQPLPLVLPYHAPCQYRAHRVGKPARDVLAFIPDLDLRDSPAACCGVAGTYGYKAEKYDIAMAVGADLFDFIRDQGDGARLVACDTETCRWQIEHGSGRAARHPIEVMAAAYGLYDLEERRLRQR